MISSGPNSNALSAMTLGRSLGVCFVCQMCEHWWRGVEIYTENSNNKGMIKCTGDDCSGPAGGGNFPMYEGPLSNLTTKCFVCGDAATSGIELKSDPGRVIGVCGDHLKVVDEYEPRKKSKMRYQ